MRKIFTQWPGRVKILSDPHFGDEAILKIERQTKFKTIEEHDTYIKKLIKQTCSGGNTFLCLGDLGEGWEDFIAHLKCYKVLVMGNHDTKNPDYYRQYFDEVYPTDIPVTDRVKASHQPILIDTRYWINVHGHLHNSNLLNDSYINANIHALDYKMLDLEDIDRLARNKKYDEHETGPKALFLREWYAELYDIDNLIATAKDGVAYLTLPEEKENIEYIPIKKNKSKYIPIIRNGFYSKLLYSFVKTHNEFLPEDKKMSYKLTDYQDYFDKITGDRLRPAALADKIGIPNDELITFNLYLNEVYKSLKGE